jgi:ABC-type nitrate/sulfonate/bicarbonate transport system substrate-binding protein
VTTVEFGTGADNYFNLPFWVGQHRGLFEAEGLTVRRHVFYSTLDNDQRLRTGEVTVAFNSTEAVVSNIEAGDPVRVVAGNLQRLPFTFIGGRDHPDVESLRGTTIGVSSLADGTSSLLRRYLGEHGLRYQQDYRMEAVGMIPRRWEMLQAGEISAGLQGVPLNLIALDEGLHDLGDVAADLDTYDFACLTVNTRWAAEQPQVLVAFLRAIIRAHDWLFTHRDQATDIAEQEMDIDRDYLLRAWDIYVGDEVFPRRADVDERGLQAVLDLTAEVRGVGGRQAESLSRYLDRSAYQEALATMG